MQELSGVSEANRELAMSRFRLIQPHLQEGRSLKLVATDANLSSVPPRDGLASTGSLGSLPLCGNHVKTGEEGESFQQRSRPQSKA